MVHQTTLRTNNQRTLKQRGNKARNWMALHVSDHNQGNAANQIASMPADRLAGRMDIPALGCCVSEGGAYSPNGR